MTSAPVTTKSLVRTRFAPSPTGHLHLGHVLHAQYVWDTATRFGAAVIVRMEDHDRARCAPEFERSILEDIAWLGFEPDPVSRASLDTRPSAYRQSDHPERYQQAFDVLRDAGLLYGCTCTRAMMGQLQDGSRHYDGRCHGKPVERDGRHVVRVQLPDESVTVSDLRLGQLHQRPAELTGDFAIRDAAGQWTYQFCVVVDDLHDEIDLIVRGEDLLSSTGAQWLFARLLGRTTPFVTLHHPLLYAADGKKLSKRDRSETVRAMRERGMSAMEVRLLAGSW